MIEKMFKTLEFNTILTLLAEKALSEKVKNKALSLKPYKNLSDVKRHTEETSEAKIIFEALGTPPLASLSTMATVVDSIHINAMLLPEQLNAVRQFIVTCERMARYLIKADSTLTNLSSYGYAFHNLRDLSEEIFRSIYGNEVDDQASPLLGTLRKKMGKLDIRIKDKLQSLLRGNSSCFSDQFVVTRHGHYTLPVKKDYKGQIKGTVIDSSSSGGTFFIEPSAVSKLQSDLSLLKIQEDNEIRKILYTLTALVEDYMPSIKINMDAMEALDFVFAKAKLSFSMDGIPATHTKDRKIIIKSGRHPLLPKDDVIPLDFYMGDYLTKDTSARHVIITGPNTGGKTVAIKTVGLLSLMAQCGLHVPAEQGVFCLNKNVLCDIGDGQSITENLSTFSSHVTNIIDILDACDENSLVLLDELGSGTDPTEGMGLATAILEEIARKKSLLVATTHYPEIKDFARHNTGFLNARMAFDREALKPLYQLEIGEAGQSCALYIAQRLGLPEHMIHRAHDIAYNSNSHKHIPTQQKIKKTSDSMDINELIDATLHTIHAQENIDSTPQSPAVHEYTIGDSVIVSPEQKIGIVYRTADEKGLIGVQIHGVKHIVNHKRITLHIAAAELYPGEDYDLSIVLDTVANRKKRHKMEKGHCADLSIEISE